MNNSDLESKPKKIEAVFGEYRFSFLTDIGVFSKENVDYGSRVLINAIEPNEGKRILDVGCGYGPIGIVLGTLFPKQRIDMVDINDRAIELARKNISLNKRDNVTVFKSNMYENVVDNYSMIISNPPIRAGKHIVHAIIENSIKHLLPEGELWIVIQKKQGAPSAKQKMQDIFGNVEVVKRDKGYFILKSVKE
jgi:16S rRNA (guanine1207-N2)-methyltransferase